MEFQPPGSLSSYFSGISARYTRPTRQVTSTFSPLPYPRKSSSSPSSTPLPFKILPYSSIPAVISVTTEVRPIIAKGFFTQLREWPSTIDKLGDIGTSDRSNIRGVAASWPLSSNFILLLRKPLHISVGRDNFLPC